MKKIIYLVFLAILTLIVAGGTLYYVSQKKPAATPLRKPTPIVQDCSVTDTGVIEAVNKYRAEIGVAPLVFNEHLDDFANQRAISQNGALDNHIGLEGAGNLFKHDIAEDQQFWAGCYNSDARVLGFKQSDRHWASLMNPKYDEIGVGFSKNVLNINLGDLR